MAQGVGFSSFLLLLLLSLFSIQKEENEQVTRWKLPKKKKKEGAEETKHTERKKRLEKKKKRMRKKKLLSHSLSSLQVSPSLGCEVKLSLSLSLVSLRSVLLRLTLNSRLSLYVFLSLSFWKSALSYLFFSLSQTLWRSLH